MRKFALALLYTAISLGANTAAAQGADIADLRTGDMKKLVVHDAPSPAPDTAFVLADGAGEATLADFGRQGGAREFLGDTGARPAARKCRCSTRCRPNTAARISRW